MTGDIDSIIDQTVSAGANGVELRLTDQDRADLPMIKLKFEDADLIIGGISTGRIAREGGHCLTDTSKVARQRAADALCVLVEMAAELGTDLLVGSAKGNRAQDESLEAYTDRLAHPMGIINQFSLGTGVRVHIEAINRYEINAVTSGLETKEFIEKYDLSNCYVHLDTFHTNIEEVDTAQTILDCGDRLGYFQCADSNRHWPGAGHIDFAAFAEPLRQVGYSGPLSIECQPIPDGVTAARNGIAHLRRTLDI